MKIITPGHKYELDHFENYGLPGCAVQTIQFIEKVPITEGSKESRTVNDGTTNEEVLKMLIDRINYLQNRFPCRENALAITKLDEALHWLNHRTAARIARGVEGQHVK